MSAVRVVTNGVPRPIVSDYELSQCEREQFDYLDWRALEAGEDSASFVRYLGSTYDLGEFTRDAGILRGSGLPAHLSSWDAYLSDSAFSAVVLRVVGDEHVVMGRVLS